MAEEEEAGLAGLTAAFRAQPLSDGPGGFEPDMILVDNDL